MCPPVIVDDVKLELKILLATLYTEIGKGRSCLFMEPKFVDNPHSYFLRDIEVNCDHAADHLKVAQDLVFKLANLLKGGEANDRQQEPETWCHII